MTEALAVLRNEDEHAVPVGPPLAGYRIVLEDADGQPAPDGAEGELVIEGLAVALGYTQPEAAGKQRFQTDGAKGRRYRTGHLGRRRGDGTMVFLGRSDDMGKIRGHRIAPAGLAEPLALHDGLRDAEIGR